MIDESRFEGLPRWGFASPGSLRDDLTRRALAGVKTATTGLRVEYELDGDPLPMPGARQVLIGSAGQPVAIVETTSAREVRLADVDDAHAIDEGEGFANAAEFRTAHERFWGTGLGQLRASLGDPTFTLDDDTPVVAERFRVIEVLGPDPGAGLTVRPAMAPDRPAVDAFLAAHAADVVARFNELVDATRHPALIAEAGGALAGVATWIATEGSLEILTLHAAQPWHGAGSALIAAARTLAGGIGARRLWLITTNDNLDALRFYQRRGLRLVTVHAGAVDRSRATLKPAIPAIGMFGIPIRDELELELGLGTGVAVVEPAVPGDPGTMPRLVAPDVRFRRSFAAAMEEFRAEGRGSADDRSVLGRYLRDHPQGLASDEVFGGLVAAIRADRLEDTARPPGFVPATELWWVDGDEYLGRVGVRHRLTPVLLEIGGHIGYDVRPSARRRGHATKMLRQALPVAHALGIDPALVTCNVDNLGSRTVIERNGGILEDERGGTLRYWVPTTASHVPAGRAPAPRFPVAGGRE